MLNCNLPCPKVMIMKVALFIPCFMDQFYPEVGIATVRILEKLGHQVDYPMEQTCCGQPAFNMGHWEEARPVARRFLEIFDAVEADAIVSPSGSCVAMVRTSYPQLFRDSAHEIDRQMSGRVASRTFELSEFLVKKLGVTDLGASFKGRVTWHDGCHALRELRVKSEPRQLLGRVQGLELIEMTECETCCGFGGAFSVKFPAISTAMDEVKVASAEEAGADFISSGDSSCLMQIRGLLEKRKSRIKAVHIAEILASS
jgi:L-lactate dehydrogenase complex protein LldE